MHSQSFIIRRFIFLINRTSIILILIIDKLFKVRQVKIRNLYILQYLILPLNYFFNKNLEFLI